MYDDNDDMAPVMDAVLGRLGARVTYGKDKDDEWISRVHHEDLEAAMIDMTDMEKEIIQKFFIDKKSLIDIAAELNISMLKLGGYIRMLRARMQIYM